jgi:hypothetical protein
VSRITYEPTGTVRGGRQWISCVPGPSVACLDQTTLPVPIPIRTASSSTTARRSSANCTVATSRPETPGAIVTYIGRSPAKRSAAPRTDNASARGLRVSRASAAPGRIPAAASHPAVARNKPLRVDAPNTVGC